MSQVSGLLKRVSTIREIYFSICHQNDSDFNIFHLCGIDHYETMHSRIIAEFLNPNASHGFGKIFLKHFLNLPSVQCHLREISGFSNSDVHDLADARVVTEEAYEGGRERLDIAIHWHGWCFVIENKIYAADQPKQLERYDEDIRKANERPIIFYLTLDGHQPSDDSAGSVKYACLSYRQDIVDWIEACVRDAYAKPYIRESLNQYRNLILELSNGEKESTMNTAVVKAIMATPEDFNSANEISKSIQDARAEVARMLMTDLQSVMDKDPVFQGWKLVSDNLCLFVDDTELGARRKYWHGFSIAGHEKYKKYFSLNGEFQVQGALKSLFIGFVGKDKSFDRAASLSFLAAARRSPSLQHYYYKFYPEEDRTNWLYGKWPDGEDKDLSFPASAADSILAGLLIEGGRKAFAERLAGYLAQMLKDAMGIADQISA